MYSTVAHSCLANVFDPLFEGGLSGATGLVMVGGSVEQEHMTRSPDRYIPVAAHLIDELALPEASKLSAQRVLQHLFIQAQISHHLTQLVVLVLELLQPPHLGR